MDYSSASATVTQVNGELKRTGRKTFTDLWTLDLAGAPSLCLRSWQTQGGDFDFLSCKTPCVDPLIVKVKVPALSQRTRQGRAPGDMSTSPNGSVVVVARHIDLPTTSPQFSRSCAYTPVRQTITLPLGLLSAISIQGDRIVRAKVIVVLTFLLFAVSSGQAGNQKVLYTFTGGVDGSQPYQAGVIFDSAGNLYGVTQYGGAYGQGTVFQLTPSPDGVWTETVLHSFTGVPDGEQPQGGLAIDGAGNLYGTTSWGGDPSAWCGTVFELSPSNSGWTYSVLHTFTNGQDGCSPQADLFFDGYSIFGTTAGGGAGRQGTAFRLSPAWPFYWVWPLLGNQRQVPGRVRFLSVGDLRHRLLRRNTKRRHCLRVRPRLYYPYKACL